VIATPNAGASYVLAGGQVGRICPDNRLGTEIVGLLSDEQRRDKMGHQARRRAAEFRLSSVIDRYEEHYQKLITQRRHRRMRLLQPASDSKWHQEQGVRASNKGVD
jgi:glycosyltransferase involved in cell wall biosynthesis